jgi:hypothetical protein
MLGVGDIRMKPILKISLPNNLNEMAVELQQEVCEFSGSADNTDELLASLESINARGEDVVEYIRELRKELDILEGFAKRQVRWSYIKMGRDHDDIPE